MLINRDYMHYNSMQFVLRHNTQNYDAAYQWRSLCLNME